METFGANGARVGISGVATVYCVHDREKRLVTDPEHVRFLGRILGVKFDPAKHILQSCACCGNLHVTENDTPILCTACRTTPAHALRAPVPQPLEERF